MTKILLYACVCLFTVCLMLFFLFNHYRGKYAEVKVKLEASQTEIKKYNESQDKATKTIVEIKEKIQYVEKDCNCYNVRIDESIINSVRNGTTK